MKPQKKVRTASKASLKDVEEKLVAGTWWPFDRVDSAVLQKLHKRLEHERKLPVPEAPF